MDELKHIKGSIRGKSKDQRVLFDNYSPRMMKLCCRYLKSQHDAEDAFIKAFNKVFEKLFTFEYRGEGSLGKWISTVMVNECLMMLRGQMHMEKIEEINEVLFMEDQSGNIDLEFIYELILSLPLGYRTVFNLFAIEGYSHKEIAEMLGITIGTSKSQLSKARQLLQAQINKNNHSYGT